MGIEKQDVSCRLTNTSMEVKKKKTSWWNKNTKREGLRKEMKRMKRDVQQAIVTETRELGECCQGDNMDWC